MDTCGWGCICAGPAFFTGLLYGNLDEALELISKWEKTDLLNAYKDAPKKGLNTNLMGKDMIYWISNLLKIAEKGLEKRGFIGKSGSDEAKYLEHLNKIINNKETVASHVINKFSKYQNLEDLYDK
jgi:glutamate--cysteine ligase